MEQRDLDCRLNQWRRDAGRHADGHDDYSRGFQTFLINELIGQAKRRLKFAL